MPTDKQRYISKLNAIVDDYVAMEDATARELVTFLQDLQAQIDRELVTASEFGDVHPQALRGNVKRLIDEFEQRATATLDASVQQSVKLGGNAEGDPLGAFGFKAAFFSPSPQQVAVLQAASADLVSDITAPLRAQVNAQITQAALGLITPFDAMRNLTAAFGQAHVKQGKLVATGVSAKVERLVRTELQTDFNLATYAQQQQSAAQIPGLLKSWIATGDGRTRRGHLEAHQRYKTPIPVEEMFIVRNWRFTKARGWFVDYNSEDGGSVEMRFPLDPTAPGWARINCRCTMATIHPEIGRIGASLDGRVAQMLKRAGGAE